MIRLYYFPDGIPLDDMGYISTAELINKKFYMLIFIRGVNRSKYIMRFICKNLYTKKQYYKDRYIDIKEQRDYIVSLAKNEIIEYKKALINQKISNIDKDFA